MFNNLFFQNRAVYQIPIPNSTTAPGGPRPASRVSSIIPSFGRLLSCFYTLALLHLPSLHLPSVTCVSLWGAFLLAHWGGLSWINHRHPAIWHVLPISICRISQCHSHHTIDTVLSFNSPSPINHSAINSPKDFELKNTKPMFILLR